MRFLPLIFLLVGCSGSIIENISWGGSNIEIHNSRWVVLKNGETYPGDSTAIETFITDFNNSKLYKISKVNEDDLNFYGLGSNKIGDYYIGSKLPGELGRYIYNSKNRTIYRAFGELASYDSYRNFKDLDLGKLLNRGEVLFIEINRIKLFNSDANIFLNNILRSDIIDLVQDQGEVIYAGEIRFSNGRDQVFYIKKGEPGYLINLGSPFSYLISSNDFNTISSF